MWGTYWVWDARLTSMLVLFLLYLGLIALWQSIEEPGRAGRAAAILALVGFINVPIIKFSVDWWNTLHQPASIFRTGGPTIDPSLLTPLFVMAARLHPALRAPAPHRHARRDPAPPRARASPDACRARRDRLKPDARAMPDLGPHAVFIWAAYGVTLVAVAALVLAHRRRTTGGSGGFSPSSNARASRGARRNGDDGAKPQAAVAKTGAKPSRRAPSQESQS